MRKKLYLLIILIGLITLVCKAQIPQSYHPIEYSIIPPSPEVASFMKSIDIPVSLFTGQPSITLPLYTIKYGSLEIPISLSYHGGGIKVNEMPGIVGLSWTLNAGGCITRTVHGYPDEAPHCNKVHWGWSETNSITGVLNLGYNERVNLRQYIINREGVNYAVDESFQYSLPYSVTNNYENGKIDVANDIFTFNCLGLSGTFIFDPETKQMVLSTPSRVSFDPSSKCAIGGSLPGSFIMYDDMMTRYEFETMEDTRLVYQTYSADSLYYISTWHLTKLISAHGDTILFKYSQPKPKDEFKGSVRSIIYRSCEPPSLGTPHVSVSTVHYYSRLLEEIETNNTKVRFQYDNNSGKLLQKISIYNKIINSQPIKEYELITDTLTLGTGYDTNHNSYTKKGIFLKEIHENNSTSNGYICLYSFDYESRYNSANYMYSQDEWGYYNGRDNSGLLTQQGANRDIDTVYSKNGVLKRITYATGGKTEFEWEQNSYSYIKGSRISMAGQQQEIESTTEHHLYARTEDNLNLFSRINVATDYFNTTYNINIGSQSTKKRIRINLRPFIKQLMDSRSALYHEQSPYYYQHTEDYDLMTKDARIELYNPQNQRVKTWFIDNYQCSKNEIDTMLYGNNGTGNYIIKLRYPYNWYLDNSDLITSSNIRNLLMNGGTENASGENGYVKIRVSTYSPAPQSFSKPWGGLRIKSIKTYSMDSPPIVKNFIYSDSLNGRYSSGTVLELPEYNSNYYDAFAGYQDGHLGVIVNEYMINYSSGLYSTPCGGSRVEYPYVWELFGENNYMVRNEFDSQRSVANCDIKDNNCDNVPSMSRIYTSRDFKRGNLKERKYIKQDQLYKKEQYHYDIKYNDTTPVFCGSFEKILHISGFGELDADYETSRYKLLPFNKTITKASCYEYFSSDGIMHNTDENAYKTERLFTYANNQTYNDAIWATYKLSESFMNSDSTIYTSYYTYINRNGFNLNLPETQVTIATRPHPSSSVIVSAKRFVYDDRNNLIATFRGRSGINADTYSLGEGLHASTQLVASLNIPEYTYRYNDNGQLIEIRYKGIPLASYMWGYRGTYPIAEIKGIGYSDVFTVLPNNLKPECLYNRYDITENDLASIRALFPNNEVTTLTYNWLIGIGSITDTHGITTRFYYDGYGRLESVKDWNNYYIEKYDYHYVNQ